MRKILAVLVILAIGLFLADLAMAELPTQLYSPIVKQAEYTTAQTNTTIWTPTIYDCVVCDGFVISANTSQKVTLSASDTVIKVHVTASHPVISPAGFLWKGSNLETMRVTTDCGEVTITLSGWEEID